MNYVEKTLYWYKEFQQFIESSGEFKPLVDLLKIKPTDLSDILKVRERHYHATMTCFIQPDLTDLMTKAVGRFNHSRLGLSSSEMLFDSQVKTHTQDLEKSGYTRFAPINPKTIQEMKDYFTQNQVIKADGTLVPLEQFDEANVAEFASDTIFRCPHLVSLASDPKIISIVERYLGAIPTAIVLCAWWSLAGKPAPKAAQFFHYDYDDYKFCKFFVYLTDVDMDSGPHVYVDGTHRHDNIVQARDQFSDKINEFDQFYLNSLRKSDEDVDFYLKRKPTYLTGPSGSNFIVDTRGIHKGLLPKNRNRLIVQVTYALSPFFQQTIHGTSSRELHPEDQKALAKKPNDYVFRLFLKDDEKNMLESQGEEKTYVYMPPPATSLLRKNEELRSPVDLEVLTKAVWGNRGFRQKLFNWVSSLRPKSFEEFRLMAKQGLQAGLGKLSGLTEEEEKAALDDLETWTTTAEATFCAYSLGGKTNPKAVFWPNPTRDPGSSVYQELPMVKNYGLIDKFTPIASAGSCFAFEISNRMQSSGFNYVVAENANRPEEGVFPETESLYERFSANWGILFNTPSLAQIAERSFMERSFPKLLVEKSEVTGNFYTDPFREAVFFATPEAYERDFPKHLKASREALLKAKVFIFTLGLNEAWELLGHDAFISRNPNSRALAYLLKHRTLTVEDNIKYIETFLKIVRRYNPDLKLILSVSPIPFIATGRAEEQHVISANGHSKAVLRVTAEEVCKRNKDVYYFPSYELVTTCIQSPWEEDQRHVNPGAVARVMNLFEKMFVKAEA